MSIMPFLKPHSKAYSFLSSIPNVVEQQPSLNRNPYQLDMSSVSAPYFMSSRRQTPPLFAPYFSPPSPLGAHHHYGAPAHTCFRHHGIFSPAHGFGFGLSSIITSYGTSDGKGKGNGMSWLDLLLGDDDETEGNKSDETGKGEKNKADDQSEGKNAESDQDTSKIDNSSTEPETNEDNKTTEPIADADHLSQPKPETSEKIEETIENANQTDAPSQPMPPSTETTPEQQSPQVADASADTASESLNTEAGTEQPFGQGGDQSEEPKEATPLATIAKPRSLKKGTKSSKTPLKKRNTANKSPAAPQESLAEPASESPAIVDEIAPVAEEIQKVEEAASEQPEPAKESLKSAAPFKMTPKRRPKTKPPTTPTLDSEAVF